MGCFSSKKRSPDSPPAHRSSNLFTHPNLEPCVKMWDGPLQPLPQLLPDEQHVQKLGKMGFAADDVRSAPQVFNGDEILAIKKPRSAEHAPAGNDKNTKPTSVSRSTKGVPVQRSGGGAAMGLKGRKVGASTPPKSQPLGGKSKKANKGTKSSK